MPIAHLYHRTGYCPDSYSDLKLSRQGSNEYHHSTLCKPKPHKTSLIIHLVMSQFISLAF